MSSRILKIVNCLSTLTPNYYIAEGEEESSGGGVSPLFLLGIVSLVCGIVYCIGIGYKIFKIVKGTYVEEEPVFLKYK